MVTMKQKKQPKIVEVYQKIEVTTYNFIENITEKNVKKYKRDFFKTYKIEPTEEEVKEFKKTIVMKKALYAIALIIVLYGLVTLH